MKADNSDNVIEMVNQMAENAIKASIDYDGKNSYPYAFGWFTADVRQTLIDLNLTKKQLKILEKRAGK